MILNPPRHHLLLIVRVLVGMGALLYLLWNNFRWLMLATQLGTLITVDRMHVSSASITDYVC